jgi:hypothetical protein
MNVFARFCVTTLVVSVLGLTASGCSLLNAAANQQDDSSQDEEAPQAASGEGFAGKWTREDNGAVFEVEDDGTTVSGKLVDGKQEYLDYFESYSFALERDGAGLKGVASFVFKDAPDETVETKWEISRDGDQGLVGELEYLNYDDDGIETSRGVDKKVFTMEAAAAAPAAAAYTPPAVDMSAYVAVMPTYKHVLHEGLAVGHWSEVRMEAGGQKSVTRTGCVGETDSEWIIEFDNQMNQKDLMLAVFVDKETGNATKAFVGKRGKKGKAKDVPPQPTPVEGDAPEAEEEEIEVGAGTYEARKYENSGITSWSGIDGDAEGVLLKMKGANIEEELLELEMTELEVSGTNFPCKRLKYKANMGEMWQASGDPMPYFKAPLKSKTPYSASELVGQGDDASPAFEYER